MSNEVINHFHTVFTFQQITLMYFYAQVMSLVSAFATVLVLERATMTKASLLIRKI